MSTLVACAKVVGLDCLRSGSSSYPPTLVDRGVNCGLFLLPGAGIPTALIAGLLAWILVPSMLVQMHLSRVYCLVRLCSCNGTCQFKLCVLRGRLWGGFAIKVPVCVSDARLKRCTCMHAC